MDCSADRLSCRTLILILHNSQTPAGLRDFLEAEAQRGISVCRPGGPAFDAPARFSVKALAQALSAFCRSRGTDPRTAMVLSDDSKFLQAAGNIPMACAGFQPPQAPFLSGAPYLFQAFTPDLSGYLEKAFCRFHGQPARIAVTRRLILRETCMADLSWLSRLYRETPAGSGAAFFPPHLTPGEQEEFLEAYIRTAYGLFDLGMYTVLSAASGKPLGHCGFRLRKEGPWLGYLISPAWRRQGLGLEACRACLDYLWESTDWEQAFCRIRSDNFPSRQLAGRLGFRQESCCPAAQEDGVLQFSLSRPAPFSGSQLS